MDCGGSFLAIQRIKDYLLQHFHICVLGPVPVFIGLHLTRDQPNCGIYIHQNHYARDILVLSNCNPRIVPFSSDSPLSLANATDYSLSGYHWLTQLPDEQLFLSRPRLCYPWLAHVPYERVLRYLRHSSTSRPASSTLSLQRWFNTS